QKLERALRADVSSPQGSAAATLPSIAGLAGLPTARGPRGLGLARGGRLTAARIVASHRLDPSEHLHPTCRCGQPWPCDLVEYARLVGEDNPPRLGASRIRPLVKARQAECL